MQDQIGWLNGVPSLLINLEKNDCIVISYSECVSVSNDSEGFEPLSTVNIEDGFKQAADRVLNAPHAEDSDYRWVQKSRVLTTLLPRR